MTDTASTPTRDRHGDFSDSTATSRIALTRHGQTDWNVEGRLQGSSNVPLNDTGRAQAVESATRFTARDWNGVATSPLSRAVETGRIIAESLGIELLDTYPGLRERDYGSAEGISDADARERWPDGEYPGLEPRDSVASRGLEAITGIADEHPGQSVIVVAHGTLIREILRRMTSVEIPPILNAATSVIEREGGEWQVVSVNDELV